jgi:polysaccharide export outer membrane protein
MLRTILTLGALAILAACASTPATSVAPGKGGEAAQTNPEYRIGAGDGLHVFVWNHPELTVTVAVRPDGLVSTPLVENMQAAGKTPSQLARDMETALSEYVRTPKVNVILTGFVGNSPDQIRVVGQAAKPQSLPYKANLTVLDVLIQAGGLSEYAAGNRARIVRRVGEQQVTIPVRLNDIQNKGDMRTNVPMLPGDVLIIPESRF